MNGIDARDALDTTNRMIRRFALFGRPVAHSISPTIHHLFAEQTGIRILYVKQEPLNFAQNVLDFFARGGHGMNITVPFKRDAWQLARQQRGKIDARAAKAQAANVLLTQDGKLTAANTDGPGLIQDLTRNLNWPIKGRRVLLLGAGGAAYGAMTDLLQARPDRVLVANRTPARARALVAHFNQPNLTDRDVADCQPKTDYDLLINATSISLHRADLDGYGHLIHPTIPVYDMFYDLKQPTAFIAFAKQRGVQQTADGLGMLVEQAAAAFMLWNRDLVDAPLDTRAVTRHLRRA